MTPAGHDAMAGANSKVVLTGSAATGFGSAGATARLQALLISVAHP